MTIDHHAAEIGADAARLPVGNLGEFEERAAGFGRWRIDLAAWRIAWSAGIGGIFGRPVPASGSLSLDDHIAFFHPDDRDAIRSVILAAAERGRAFAGMPYQNRVRIVRPGGEIRDVLVHGRGLWDDGQGELSLGGVTVDVTSLSVLERKVEATAGLLRCTLENIDQGLLMMDADNRVRVWNRRMVDLVGIPEHLLRDGAPFADVLAHGVAAGEYERADPSSVLWSKTGAVERQPAVYERRRPNGTVLEIRAVPLADGGVVRTFSDVTESRDAELAAREGEVRYRLLAENTTDVIVGTDAALNRHYVSPSITAMLGYEPHEAMEKNRLPVHPEDHDDYEAFLDDLMAGRRSHAVSTVRYRHRDGAYIWGEISVTAIGGRGGQPVSGFVASIRNVTERKAGELALRLSEERLALALDSGADGLWDYDLASGRVHLSGQWLRGLGLDPRGITTDFEGWTALAHVDDRDRLRAAVRELLAGSAPVLDCECRMRVDRTNHGWTLMRGKVVLRDRNGLPLRTIGTHVDITRRKEAEQLVAHMAMHDALTGLPNRALFRDHLARELLAFERYGTPCAVLACDLDQFKAVNDTLGHPAGDLLLCEIAMRLVAVLRPCDMVARLGGDEFALVLGRIDRARWDASSVALRIIEAVSRPIEVEGATLVVGISIGVALASDASLGADQLFKQADIALYQAKGAGRNTFRVFEPGMDTAMSRRISLERELRVAVDRESLDIAYQPVFSIPDGRVIGCEALLRWRRAGGEPVSPAEFIPIAEETGLIVPLGAWVLREACREAASWPDGIRVAVNVSSVQFRQPGRSGQSGLEDAVRSALTLSSLAPNRLELEITESVLLHDADPTIATLRRLQAIGVRIALDDFGTGYSSLNYLRRFPFNKIKIDKVFVDDIGDPGTCAIVRAVVGLGSRARADITAEGIETADQLRRVSEQGCTEAQGFLLGRPSTPRDVVAAILRSRGPGGGGDAGRLGAADPPRGAPAPGD